MCKMLRRYGWPILLCTGSLTVLKKSGAGSISNSESEKIVFSVENSFALIAKLVITVTFCIVLCSIGCSVRRLTVESLEEGISNVQGKMKQISADVSKENKEIESLQEEVACLKRMIREATAKLDALTNEVDVVQQKQECAIWCFLL